MSLRPHRRRQRPGRVRPVVRALVVALLLVALVSGGLIAALAWFPAPLLRAGLRAAGLEAVAFQDLRLGPTSLELIGLEIGAPPAQRVARLAVRYHLRDLLRGRVARVEATGLQLRGRIAAGRLELAGLEPAGLETPASDTGGGLSLPVWPQEVAVQAASIELTTPWGELRLPLSGALRPGSPEAEFELSVVGGQLINDAGRLRADLELRGHLPLDPAVALAAVTAQGRLDLVAESFALPELAEAIDGQGALTFELTGGRIDARLGPAEVRVGALAPPLATLAEALPPPWQIRLGDRSGPIRITGPLAGEAPTLEVAGGLDLAAGQARVGADLQATLRGNAEGRLTAATVAGTLTAGQIRWRELRLTGGRLGLQAEGQPGQWQGTLDLALAGGGAPAPGLALEGAALRQKLAFTAAGEHWTLTAREAGHLAIDRVTWPDGRAGPLAWQLEPGDPPLLTITLAADGALVWQQALRASCDAFELIAQAAGTPLAGRAQIAHLTLVTSGDAQGLRAGKVGLAGGQLKLPGQQLTLDGIATELALGAAGLAPDQSIPITVGTISHGGKPAWFAPLALDGTLRPSAGQVAFEARLSRAVDALALTLRGRHDLARGRGQAALALAPLTFAPGARQPRQLAPVLGDRLRDVAGRIALDGTLAWGAGDQVTADLALLLENLAFTAGPARFEQVNGVLHVDRLWPPRTPPGQQLAIGLLDLGLPLTGGLIGFRLDQDQALAVEQLRWSFAGGTISAQPFRVGSATSDMILTLTAAELDLAQLFGLTRLDGLSGEGRVHGTLPIRIAGGVAVIEGGELVTDRPGRLRYRPAAPPAALQAGGESVGLLLQALENFHYETLRITLDGPTDAAMDIGLHVRGANPELYDGYPVEFNLSLEGELANILRSGLAVYQIPERIREQMQGFQR